MVGVKGMTWARVVARGQKCAVHPLYEMWKMMRKRCYWPKHHGYQNWGARGIKVCGRWRSSFWNFVEDMGERPAGMVLDRIDNDGDYEPGNCRWATHSQSQENRRPPRRT
jgi:hypothetical protein